MPVCLGTRLAGDLTFSNARAYVGTLFPVTPVEASEVVIKVLDKHWSKPLPVAFWAAQRDVYGDGSRRPYIVNGVFPQRLRVKQMDYPARITRRLARGLVGWTKRYKACDPSDTKQKKALEEIVKVYRRELNHFLRQGQ